MRKNKDGGEEKFLAEVQERLFKGLKVPLQDVVVGSPTFCKEVVVEFSRSPCGAAMIIKDKRGVNHFHMQISFAEGKVEAVVQQVGDWENGKCTAKFSVDQQDKVIL